jgi:hypothetical protein
MTDARRLWRLLVAGLMLSAAVLPAGPAAAAPCTGAGCYRYYADISFAGYWVNPSAIPVFPGSRFSLTAQVTNTGWRVGGNSAPRPWPGPTSGVVYVSLEPGTPDAQRVACRLDSGNGLGCGAGYRNGLYFDLQHMPTGATYQMTADFLAPQQPGTYTARFWIYAFQEPYTWTEYNPDNNVVTLTYRVGYLA